MKIKEFLLLHLQIYCILVTLIFAAITMIGVIFDPEEALGYHQLAVPFILTALCVLPTFITYFKTEPPLPQFIIRHVIQLAVIECIVLLAIKTPDGSDAIWFRVLIGAIVFAIYAIAKIAVWLQKYRQSKKLTEQLKNLQKGKTE